MLRRRRVTIAISFLVNARDLRLDCARVLQETLLVPIIMYGSEIMILKEEERLRMMTVQMDNFRSLLGIQKIDKILNA